MEHSASPISQAKVNGRRVVRVTKAGAPVVEVHGADGAPTVWQIAHGG